MSQLVTITMLAGEFIHPAWREEGTVHEVDKEIAERWVKHGSAKYGSDPFAKTVDASAVTHELGEFPSAALFAAAGYTTLDAIKAMITEKGDVWPKSVKGMTKALAAKVSEALEAMANPTPPADTPPAG